VEYREKLIGMLPRCEFNPLMVKRVLTMICHRVEASRPTGYVDIEGLLQFLGSAMDLAKQNLQPRHLDTVKEFMVLRLNHLRTLCMTSVPRSVRDGELACNLSV
jgi:hypothetical protein